MPYSVLVLRPEIKRLLQQLQLGLRHVTKWMAELAGLVEAYQHVPSVGKKFYSIEDVGDRDRHHGDPGRARLIVISSVIPVISEVERAA